MDESTISPITPSPILAGSPSGGAGPQKFILPLILIAIVIALIFGGATFLRSRQEAIPAPSPFPTAEPTEVPTPTEEVTPPAKPKATPTKKPTPTKEATPSAASKELTVRVLNGSGVTGRAAATAEFLKGLGYEIGGTGNADKDDYDKTTITIKKAKESLLAQLKTDLATKYAVGTTSATLATSESYDALVIIGKQ